MDHTDISADVSTNELSRRLKVLLKSLQDLEATPEVAREHSEVALKLAEDNFMTHNSREIRILTACCIADILRIFSPDSPYGDPRTIKSVLMFLARQLSGLQNIKDSLYPRFYYLLENLTTVKSLMLALDLEDSQDITMVLIRSLLASVNDQLQEERISGFVVEIVTPLLREAERIPFKLLDPLLLPLTETHRNRNPFAAKVAEKIVQGCENYLEIPIQTFFAQSLSSTEPLKDSELSSKTCDIFFHLYQIIPDTMLPAMAQLENRLMVPDDKLRKETLTLVIKLLKEDTSGLGDDHSSLFEGFIGRFTDKSPEIRSICIDSVPKLIAAHPNMRKRLIETVITRTRDTEEVIRKDAITVSIHVLKKLQDESPDDLFEAVVQRIRDKKFVVRKEAMIGLATLYRAVTLKEASPEMKEKVKGIRTTILQQYWTNSMEDKLLVERLFYTCLVPYQLPSEQRMEMLFNAYQELDNDGRKSSIKAIHAIILAQFQVRKLVKIILELHHQSDSESRRNRIQHYLRKVSNELVDPLRCHEDLKLFYNLLSQDEEILENVEYIVGNSYTSKGAEQRVKETMKKISTDDNFAGIKSTVQSLFERVAPVMMDSEAMEALVEKVYYCVYGESKIGEEEQDFAEERALSLIKALAKPFSHCFMAERTLKRLLGLLEGPHNFGTEVAVLVFNEVGKDLELVEGGKFASIYEKLVPELTRVARGGTPKEVKNSIRCLNSIVSDEKERIRIFSAIFSALQNQATGEFNNCVSALTGLGILSQCAPHHFKDAITKKIGYLVPKLILKFTQEEADEDVRWLPREKLHKLSRAKIAAIKLIVRWLCGVKCATEPVAGKTVKMMLTFIQTRGDPSMKSPPSVPERAHLRLVAGCMLLKLSQFGEYRPLIKCEHLEALSGLLHDDVKEVRAIFLGKLKRAMYSSTPIEFLSLFCFASLCRPKEMSLVKAFVGEAATIASDIVRFRRTQALQYPENRKVSYFHPEWALPHAVYMLSRHPRLKHRGDIAVLEEIRDCLWLLLDPLVNQKKPDGSTSYEYVHQLLQTIKDHRDAKCDKGDQQNQKLWAVCDIGIMLIQYRSLNTTLKGTMAAPIPLDGYHGLFEQEFEPGGNRNVYIPQELIDQEKRANPKSRKPLGIAPAKSKGNTSRVGAKRKREKVEEIEDDDDVEESIPKPTTSRTRGKQPLPTKSPAASLNVRKSQFVTSTPIPSANETQSSIKRFIKSPTESSAQNHSSSSSSSKARALQKKEKLLNSGKNSSRMAKTGRMDNGSPKDMTTPKKAKVSRPVTKESSTTSSPTVSTISEKNSRSVRATRRSQQAEVELTSSSRDEKALGIKRTPVKKATPVSPKVMSAKKLARLKSEIRRESVIGESTSSANEAEKAPVRKQPRRKAKNIQ